MTGFTEEQLKLLKSPLLETKIKTREQGKTKLSYIEGWHAIAEANRIFGYDKWSRETLRLEQAMKPTAIPGKIWKGKQNPDQIGVAYLAVVRVTVNANGETIVRDGTGFGMAQQGSAAGAMEMAVKTAETDGMKRALACFGDQFGLTLYDKEQSNVTDDPIAAGVQRDPETVLQDIEDKLAALEDSRAFDSFTRESGDFDKLLNELELDEDVSVAKKLLKKAEKRFE